MQLGTGWVEGKSKREKDRQHTGSVMWRFSTEKSHSVIKPDFPSTTSSHNEVDSQRDGWCSFACVASGSYLVTFMDFGVPANVNLDRLPEVSV